MEQLRKQILKLSPQQSHFIIMELLVQCASEWGTTSTWMEDKLKQLKQEYEELT